MGLLLDIEDAAVTRQTAEALARVGTVAAVRLIALAVAEADDSQADWLQTGVHDALAGPGGVPDVAAACGKLARDPEESCPSGGRGHLGMGGQHKVLICIDLSVGWFTQPLPQGRGVRRGRRRGAWRTGR